MELIKVDSSWKDSDLRIEFMLGNLCNFKCWYCFPGSNEGTHRFPDFDLTVKHLLHVIRHYRANGKKRVFLHIIGGEPTIWPRLGEFAEIFSKENCYISISTNGSRTLRWWREYGKYFSKVILSCHHQEMNLEHNIAVGDILYESGCIIDASVLMDPNAWDKCVSIVEGLRKSKRRWSILASEVMHSTVNYTEEQRKYLHGYLKRMPNLWYYFKNNKHPVDNVVVTFENGSKKRAKSNWIRLAKLNHFKGWDCNVGIDSFFINKDGRISGACGEKLYRENFYYNLYDLDFEQKFNPTIQTVICSLSDCVCQPEINLKKHKIIELVPISSTEYPLNKYNSF